MKLYQVTRKVEEVEINDDKLWELIRELAENEEDLKWINSHSLEENVEEFSIDIDLVANADSVKQINDQSSIELTKDDAIDVLEFGVH